MSTIAKANPDSLALAFRVADAVQRAGLPAAHEVGGYRGRINLYWGGSPYVTIKVASTGVQFEGLAGACGIDGWWTPDPDGPLTLPAALAAMIREVAQ
jgi:hypothetical protein